MLATALLLALLARAPARVGAGVLQGVGNGGLSAARMQNEPRLAHTHPRPSNP